MGIFPRKASGLLAAVAAASLAMLLCSCSVINEKLEEYGLDDLGDKLETVWNEVGIDTIRDMTDEAWREFGFGKSLDWPESGPGSKLPVLRSGRMDGSYSNGSSGFIVMAEITQEARSAYEDELVSLGFSRSEDGGPLSFGGVFVLLVYDEGSETLIIYYGSSEEELKALVSSPPSLDESAQDISG